MSLQDIVSFLKKNLSGFVLKMHYNHIGSCQSSIDVMQDHLEMAFILEKLLQYSRITRYERNYSAYPPDIFATLIPNESTIFLLAEELFYVSVLKAKESDPDEESLDSITNDLIDFEDEIEQISFKFIDEIEDYYANYINQGIYEIASESSDDENEYLSSYFSKNPEWEYGFWKHHLSKIPKESVYFSSFCWVVKNDVGINLLLSKYSGIEEVTFNDAILVDALIFNDFTVIDFNSFENIDTAFSLIDKLSKTSNKSIAIQISQNIDIVKISYSGYFIIYFNFQKLRENTIKELYEKATWLKERLSTLLGFSKKTSYDWNILTDESFEELCHNIIYNDIRFDRLTIRKMGKSKSRDGGRDIVVWTKSQLGNAAKKYIVQCKLLKKSSSLKKSMMHSISNVIMEYEADGYIIMTNAKIDGGLYDMLDGFSRNEKMKTDTKTNFSRLELELYLDSHGDLKQRYFE